MNSAPAREKLTVYGVRANWRCGSSPSGVSTISPTRPEGWTRVALVQEREAFTVAGGSFGDVRDDDLPVQAQSHQEPLQAHGVAVGLLDSDDVVPGNHGGQAGDGVLVPLR